MKKSHKIAAWITGAILVAVPLTLGLTGYEPEFSADEERAYDRVVKLYTGKEAINTFPKADVVNDINEFCGNLTKHEYRSDAAQATDFVTDELSYELSLIYGVEVICPDDWSKAKKME